MHLDSATKYFNVNLIINLMFDDTKFLIDLLAGSSKIKIMLNFGFKLHVSFPLFENITIKVSKMKYCPLLSTYIVI